MRTIATTALILLFFANRPAAAQSKTVIQGTVTWQDVQAGYVDITILDADTFEFLGSASTFAGGVTVAGNKRSASYSVSIAGSRASYAAAVNVSSCGDGFCLSAPGVNYFGR